MVTKSTTTKPKKTSSTTAAKNKAQPAADRFSITIGDKEFYYDELSKDIQDLVNIYQQWEKEYNTQRIEVYKTEQAIRSIYFNICSMLNVEVK